MAINHHNPQGYRKDLGVDVFSLGRERDDKATSHRRLANQENPVEEKDEIKIF